MRTGAIVTLILLAAAGLAAQNAPGSLPDDATRRQLIPTGTLRVGLNTGNPLTRFIGAELGRELARRLGVEVAVKEYDSPGAVTDAAGREWDIGFVAADPDRADAVDFTSPYVEIDATYLVPAGSMLRTTADADRKGVTIATGTTSAYTLVLKREMKQAELVLGTNDEGLKRLQAGQVHALAGLRFNLEQWAAKMPGSRVLGDSFTRAQQAIAMPKGRPAAAKYLESFIAEMRRTGVIAGAIKKTGLSGATVPSR
jgi:polar amino acid transport system substrate-binding protein